MQSLGPHREDPEPLDLFSSRGVSKLPKTTVEQTQRLSEVPANARAGRRMVQFFPLGSAHPRHLSFLATLPSSAFAALRPPFRRKTVSSSALPQRGGGLLRVDDKPFYSSSFSLRGRQPAWLMTAWTSAARTRGQMWWGRRWWLWGFFGAVQATQASRRPANDELDGQCLC